jgi:hypothetical protein
MLSLIAAGAVLFIGLLVMAAIALGAIVVLIRMK